MIDPADLFWGLLGYRRGAATMTRGRDVATLAVWRHGCSAREADAALLAACRPFIDSGWRVVMRTCRGGCVTFIPPGDGRRIGTMAVE